MSLGPLGRVWQDVAVWRWPCLVLICLCLGLTPIACQGLYDWQPRGAQAVAERLVTLETKGSLRSAGKLEMRFGGAVGLVDPRLSVNGVVAPLHEEPVDEQALDGDRYLLAAVQQPGDRAAITIELHTAQGASPVVWTLIDRGPNAAADEERDEETR